MNPLNTFPPEHTLAETVDGVTYRGRWYIDNHVVVLYVGSVGPLTKMVLSVSPEIVAHQLFHEFMANEVTRRRAQRAKGSDPESG
jgi:hypothetical protein